jgi:arylsulfatase
MLGSRSIFHEGWKATTNHISTGVLDEEELAIGSRDFDDDRWELFNLSEDFSEAVDRAEAEPDRLRQLTALWSTEAERNQVLPISDGMLDRFSGFIGSPYPAGATQTFHPGGGPVHDESIPLLWGGFEIAADIDTIGADTEGVVCAMGDWFGGFALFLTEGSVHFAFARSADVLHLSTPMPAPAGSCRLTVTYSLGDAGGPGHMALTVNDAPVDQITVDGMLPLALQHGGTGLRIGYDSGFPVSRRYAPPAPFTGVVHRVTIGTTPGPVVPEPADEMRAALHAD